MTYGDDEPMEKKVGGAVYKAGHDELGARQRSMAKAAMAMHNVALPQLGWWH